jgi:hypothetical protein
MNHFRMRAAMRNATVGAVPAVFASTVVWSVARENAEESIVSLAKEKSQRMLFQYQDMDLSGVDAIRRLPKRNA